MKPDHWMTDDLPAIDGDKEAHTGRCPKCREPLEGGFGLMGGGYGSYNYCPIVQDDGGYHWMEKWEDRG